MLREKLIRELTNVINNREKTKLTNDQVEHYIGSDMPDETLWHWVDETKHGENAVSAEDVLSLWDEGDERKIREKKKQLFGLKGYILAEILWFGDCSRGDFEVLYRLCAALTEPRLDSLLYDEIRDLKSRGKAILKSSIECHISAYDDDADACEPENNDHMNWFIARELIAEKLTIDEIIIRSEPNCEPRRLIDVA